MAVRLGRARTRVLYDAMLVLAYVTVLIPFVAGDFDAWLALPWLTLPLALRLQSIVRTHTDGPTLNEALAGTGKLEFLFCVLLAVGLMLS
jgi:1,4-dihydroxy-2-naphthoate octaprenyltransferase